MFRVGLTGGIGSGKTIIADIFKTLNIAVFNSDLVAKEIMVSDKEIKNSLIQIFGNDIYFEKEINKKRLAEIIFSEQEQLKKINVIVHPAVKKRFVLWTKEHKDDCYIILENAIIFESGTDTDLDKIITVSCPEQIRIERIMKRDNRTIESVKNIMKNQMSESEKIERSQFVIVNDGKTLVIPQVLDIHNSLVKMSKQ